MPYHRVDKYRITIGPEEAATEIVGLDVILSVADTPPLMLGCHDPWIQVFWYPIHEMQPWGYGPFYWTKKLLDQFTTVSNLNILVHCHAGAHRSPMMVWWWLRSKGYTEEQCGELMKDSTFYQLVGSDLRDGTIPLDLKNFYALMDQHPTYRLMGILNILHPPSRRRRA